MKTREILSLGTRRFRLRGNVSALASSPDGKLLAASSSTLDEVVVFELPSGRPVLRSNTCADYLLFTPDGGLLVAAFGYLHAWTVEGLRAQEDPRFEGLGRPIACARNAGLFVATARETNDVVAFPLASPGPVRTLHTSKVPIRGLALSYDGSLLLVATGTSAVQVINVTTGEARSLADHTRDHNVVEFRPRSQSFVTGGRGRSLFFASAQSPGRALRCDGQPRAFAFSPDGARLAVFTSGDVVMFDVEKGTQLWKQVGSGMSEPALAFVGEGETLAVAVQSKVRFLDAGSGAVLDADDDPFDRITDLAVSPDGGRVVTTSRDLSVDLWDLHTGARVRRLGEHDISALCAAFSPDGSTVVSGGADNKLRFWRTDLAVAGRRPPAPIRGEWSDVTSVAWSPDGATIAFVDEHGAIHVLDVSTWATRLLLAGQGGNTADFTVAFTADDTLVASVHGEVIVIRVSTGSINARESASSPVLSRRGDWVASADTHVVRVLRLPDLSVLVQRNMSVVSALAIGSSGQLAVAPFDDSVRFYDSRSGGPFVVLDRERGHASALAILDDGRLLAGTSHGETLLLSTEPEAAAVEPPKTVVLVPRDEEPPVELVAPIGRALELAALLDAFRRRALPGGYRGTAPARGDGAADLDVTVPISGGSARVRAAIVTEEIELSIAVAAGNDPPPDLVPRDPIARARRWIKDRLSADARRSSQEEAAFLATLPPTTGLVRARLLRDPRALTLVVVTTAVPEATWLEAAVALLQVEVQLRAPGVALE